MVIIATPAGFAAAAKGKVEVSTGINNETLTGGVLHEDGMYLPRGMKIPCILRTPIDTRVSKESDQITLQTTEDVMIGDYTLIPANSFIHGYISELAVPKTMHRKPRLELSFDSVSLPVKGNEDRKYIKLKGSIHNKDIMAKAAKVNDGEMYKSKARKVGALGAAGGAVSAYGVTQYMAPFATWGIEGMVNNMFILGSGMAGAYLATGLLVKDDVRLEAGAELSMMLDETTVEVYQNQKLLSMENIKGLTPVEAYDKMTTLESEPLKGVKVSQHVD